MRGMDNLTLSKKNGGAEPRRTGPTESLATPRRHLRI